MSATTHWIPFGVTAAGCLAAVTWWPVGLKPRCVSAIAATTGVEHAV
jgi:hypothetical protein